MILTVTLNPSVDRAVYVSELKLGDTNRVERTETDAGGKGINLSRVADELGADTLAIGFLGGGPGAFVRSVLDRERVAHDFVEIDGDTRINFSVEDRSGAPPTTFNERGPSIGAEAWEALLAKCRQHVPAATWACLGGSIPPSLTPDVYRTLGSFFKNAGKRVLLDADGEALKLGLEMKPDLAKPNAKEAERLLGRTIANDSDAIGAARAIRSLGADRVLLSRGSHGAIYVDAQVALLGRSPVIEACSSIGSGDSMLGAFLWGFDSGLSISECLAWGLAAGAATAATNGSEIGRQAFIEKLLPLAQVTAI